jgi:hypothetical protein
MTYQLTTTDSILRLTDNATIPLDLRNVDYQQYLLWLEEGNNPLPADPTPEARELTVQEKLQSSGLTVEEIKTLLGLN